MLLGPVKKAIVCLLSIATICFATVSVASPESLAIQKADEKGGEEFQKDKVGSVSIAIVSEGHVAWTMAIRLVALCCWMFCAQVYADTATEKMALAERLTKLTGTEEVYQRYFKECSSKTIAVDMAAVGYREHPEAFGGLSPDSNYWREVEAIYSRYHVAMCGDGSAGSLAQLFSSQYATQMSTDDLRAAIAFYSSPAGQLLSKLDLQANGMVQEKLETLQHAARTAAEDQYQRDMANLIKKFQSDPSASFGSSKPQRP